MDEKKQERIADLAMSAFFEEVAKHYPEVKTGDFPPDAHFDLLSACQDALSTWLEWNHPDSDIFNDEE